jgi:AraC-like DNA-binding protein
MKVWIVLYAVGAVQAAMLALALWRRPANAHANRVLSAWLAIVAVDLAIKALHLASPGAGLGAAYRVLRLLPFVYAPLFFVYVRALTTNRGIAWTDAWHLAWFGLALAWALARWLGGTPLAVAGSWHAPWFDPVLFSVAFAYLIGTVLLMRRYRRRLWQRRSDADRLSLRWLAAMAACQFAVWGIATAQWLVRAPFLDYYAIYGAVAAWVCVVGWFSLAQPPVADLEEGGEGPGVPAASGTAGERVEDPRFDDVEARLSSLMADERMYREPALAISQLARRTGYPEYLVSAVINRRLGGNFWEYVNRYRIAEARACLEDPGDRRSILDIAYDAGFTSKSTFNNAFKRLVGQTPSAYRRGRVKAATQPPA